MSLLGISCKSDVKIPYEKNVSMGVQKLPPRCSTKKGVLKNSAKFT